MGPLDDSLRGLQRVLHRRVRVALVERLGRRERRVHLAERRLAQPVVTLLVEDEAGVDDSLTRVDRRDDLLRARHLRHARRVHEADGLDPRQPRRREPIDELGAGRGHEDRGIVLQPVPGGNVADGDRHDTHQPVSGRRGRIYPAPTT